MKCEDCWFYSMWDGCCMHPCVERTWLNMQGQEACELFEEERRDGRRRKRRKKDEH